MGVEQEVVLLQEVTIGETGPKVWEGLQVHQHGERDCRYSATLTGSSSNYKTHLKKSKIHILIMNYLVRCFIILNSVWCVVCVSDQLGNSKILDHLELELQFHQQVL